MNYEIVELEGKTLVGLKMRVKDDKTITFAFTDEECIEKNDEEILSNFYNNK